MTLTEDNPPRAGHSPPSPPSPLSHLQSQCPLGGLNRICYMLGSFKLSTLSIVPFKLTSVVRLYPVSDCLLCCRGEGGGTCMIVTMGKGSLGVQQVNCLVTLSFMIFTAARGPWGFAFPLTGLPSAAGCQLLPIFFQARCRRCGLGRNLDMVALASCQVPSPQSCLPKTLTSFLVSMGTCIIFTTGSRHAACI